MLLSLNDDCLRLVIGQLEFDDQMRMAHVCLHLNIIVTEVWQHHFKTIKFDIDSESPYLIKCKEYFLEYIRCIRDRIEVLKLTANNSSAMTNIYDIQFPNVNNLTIDCNDLDYEENDQNLKLIKHNFPSLISLRIEGNITGAHLCKFKNLQELYLTECYVLRAQHLKEIFSNLSLKIIGIHSLYDDGSFEEAAKSIVACQTLEEIYVVDFLLKEMFESLIEMKNLRKILFYVDIENDRLSFELLKKLMKRYGSVMESMIINYNFEWCSDLMDYWNGMTNLRRLVLNGFSCIGKENLNRISARLSKTLQEFHLRNLVFFISYTNELLEMVKQCTNLKLLDLTNTKIDVNFIKTVAKIIYNQSEERSQTLLLRSCRSGIRDEHIKSLYLPNKLQISLEENKLQHFSYNIECELSSSMT